MSEILVIEVEFSDGRVFHIRASVIAEDRARYYANHDHPGGGTDWLETFENEVDYALSDDSELLDWAHNNTNWEDVAMHAIEVTTQPLPPNREAEWPNAKKQVIR
jgi:hypothetical protein